MNFKTMKFVEGVREKAAWRYVEARWFGEGAKPPAHVFLFLGNLRISAYVPPSKYQNPSIKFNALRLGLISCYTCGSDTSK